MLFQKNFEGGLSFFKVEAENVFNLHGYVVFITSTPTRGEKQFWCCLVFDSQKTVQSSRLMKGSEIVASLKTLIYT